MGITVSTVLRASIQAHLLRSVKLYASTVMLGSTVGPQTRSYMDLIFACNAHGTAQVGLVPSLDLAMLLRPSVLATLATLFPRAFHGTQQKTFDYQQRSFVSRALQARISLKQCNGEKSGTRQSLCILLVYRVPRT